MESFMLAFPLLRRRPDSAAAAAAAAEAFTRYLAAMH